MTGPALERARAALRMAQGTRDADRRRGHATIARMALDVAIAEVATLAGELAIIEDDLAQAGMAHRGER